MKLKKIAFILVVLLLVSSLLCCGSGDNSTGQIEKELAVQSEAETEIQVLNSVVSEGLFKVEFTKGDKTYSGVADNKGQIFYYTDNYEFGDYLDVDFTPISENAGYLCETIGDKELYTVINSTGSKKSFNKEDFDEIIGKGGGYILVYKNTGDVSKEEHSYGLINSEGEWDVELTPGAKLPEGGSIYSSYKHLGDKVFYQTNNYNNIGGVIDCAINNTIDFRKCTIKSTGVHNGKFIVSDGFYCTPCGSEEKEIDGCYVFSTDGTCEQGPDIISASEKIAVYKELDKLQIWDMESNSISEYSDVPANQIIDVSCVGEYALIIIHGLDDKFYITVVDSKGEQQFEPQLCLNMKQVEFTGDRTIYQTEDNYYEMIDNNGNPIISRDEKYTLSINGKIVTAKGKSGKLYFDKNGNEISFSLK